MALFPPLAGIDNEDPHFGTLPFDIFNYPGNQHTLAHPRRPRNEHVHGKGINIDKGMLAGRTPFVHDQAHIRGGGGRITLDLGTEVTLGKFFGPFHHG